MEEYEKSSNNHRRIAKLIKYTAVVFCLIGFFLNFSFNRSEEIPVSVVTLVKENEKLSSTVVIEKGTEHMYDSNYNEDIYVDCMYLYTSVTSYDLSFYNLEEKTELENEIKEKEELYKSVSPIDYSTEYQDNTIIETIVQESKKGIDRRILGDKVSIGTVKVVYGQARGGLYVDSEQVIKELQDSGYTIESIKEEGTYNNIK